MAIRLMLVGGFLGAGKTTLLLQSAQLLAAKGYRVGIVTNDQAQDLVDTALVRAQNIPVREVAGGCFCCRFPDLLTSIQRLQEEVHPDVILCEPVGSCTDLVATIFRQLHTYYPAQFHLAPLTVLVDPQRDQAYFPSEVSYIYYKQLAEANVIAISKSETLDGNQMDKKIQELQELYPHAYVTGISTKTGVGLDAWLERCLQQSSTLEHTLEMDYDLYAQGEARLGWLNAHISLLAPTPFSPQDWMAQMLRIIEQQCAIKSAAVAHIKLHVTSSNTSWKVSLTQLGNPASWDTCPTEVAIREAQAIINARVGTDPSTLEALTRRALEEVQSSSGIQYAITNLECFSPLP
ncbi:MAG: GTP-binding protein, partial [Ktedonobacteraceae bacterium]